MTDQEAPPRFPEASALGPAVEAAPATEAGLSENGSTDRPELMVAATFIGGFAAAKILKRVAGQ